MQNHIAFKGPYSIKQLLDLLIKADKLGCEIDPNIGISLTIVAGKKPENINKLAIEIKAFK